MHGGAVGPDATEDGQVGGGEGNPPLYPTSNVSSAGMGLDSTPAPIALPPTPPHVNPQVCMCFCVCVRACIYGCPPPPPPFSLRLSLLPFPPSPSLSLCPLSASRCTHNPSQAPTAQETIASAPTLGQGEEEPPLFDSHPQHFEIEREDGTNAGEGVLTHVCACALAHACACPVLGCVHAWGSRGRANERAQASQRHSPDAYMRKNACSV